MVEEIRRIMFTQEELVTAFDSYRRATPGFLPAGQIVSCTPSDHAISVALKTDTASPTLDYTFKGSEAIRPLIRFCLENNIMMPRAGQKSLYVRNGAASLYVVYNLNVIKDSGAADGDPAETSDTFIE